MPLLTPSAVSPTLLAMWFRATNALDASDAIISADGTAAKTWVDLSGNGLNATQGTAGNRPVYKAAQVNGYPALQTTNISRHGFLSGSFTAAASVGIVAVMQVDTFTAFRMYSGRTTTAPLFMPQCDSTDNRWALHTAGSGYFTETTDTNAGAGVFRVCAFYVAGSTSAIKINGGAARTAGSATSQAMTGIHGVLNTYDSAAALLSASGLLSRTAEHIFHNGDLTAPFAAANNNTYLAFYEGYLAWRYGLQSSLPSGHPYKNAAPSTPDSEGNRLRLRRGR